MEEEDAGKDRKGVRGGKGEGGEWRRRRWVKWGRGEEGGENASMTLDPFPKPYCQPKQRINFCQFYYKFSSIDDVTVITNTMFVYPLCRTLR